ncbi:hypothetical protein ACB092_11G239100 [Castanea dentata]
MVKKNNFVLHNEIQYLDLLLLVELDLLSSFRCEQPNPGSCNFLLRWDSSEYPVSSKTLGQAMMSNWGNSKYRGNEETLGQAMK